MKHATHVVVDTLDGYVFWTDAYRELFNLTTASMFAIYRNNLSKSTSKPYKVFALVPVDTEA